MSTQSWVKCWSHAAIAGLLQTSVLATVAYAANAQEFGQGARRELLETVTTDLPQGKLRVGGGERAVPPGGRSDWHSSGPKILYVIEGTVTVQGLGGQTYASCGPGPNLCLTPNKSPFYFRNAGPGLLKFVVIGIDSVDRPTIHEEVGSVTAIAGNRVTLAIGDHRGTALATPPREMTLTVSTIGSIAVGDDVLTQRLNKTGNTAESLIKLSKRWQ